MRKAFRVGVCTVMLAWLSGRPALADVRLPALFSEGMVLQQGMEVPVWGWADDGEQVTVRFMGQEVSATAHAGKWILRLKPLSPGGPAPMTIQGKNTLHLEQVFVGEVWVCSGQSNMAMTLASTENPEAEIARSANPKIRLFTVARAKSMVPLDDVKGQWVECGPSTVGSFSAVAYYFGRDLQRALNVPVGLIHTSWGGSPAEVWMSPRVLLADPEYRALWDRAGQALARYRDALWQVATNLESIKAENARAIAEAEAKGQALVDAAAGRSEAERAAAMAERQRIVAAARRAAAARLAPTRPWVPGELYNAMIAPLIPYGIRGAIWYQGEANASRAYQYRRLFPDMIRNWREDWGQGDFPFLCVQLAPYKAIQDQPGESDWAELREAQLLATKTLPKVGMAVITDVGDPNDIHPKKKEPVGARLALAALGIAYNRPIVYSGPVYRAMKVKGNRVVLHFDHVGSGLEARGGDLKGFALCGADRKWVWAKATIQGNTVVVSSPEVRRPIAVRYGWADCPVVNLWNKEGLPASPFRTDDFPMITRPRPQ